jgi:hypothetical protein
MCPAVNKQAAYRVPQLVAEGHGGADGVSVSKRTRPSARLPGLLLLEACSLAWWLGGANSRSICTKSSPRRNWSKTSKMRYWRAARQASTSCAGGAPA